MQILTGEPPIIVQVEFRRRKSYQIRIDHEGQVQLVAPIGSRESEIREIIEKKRGWIFRKIKGIADQQNAMPRYSLKEGGRVPFLGRDYLVRLLSDPSNKEVDVNLDGEELQIRWSSHNSDWRQSVVFWYKMKAKEYLQERVQTFLPQFPVEPGRISIRSQKTRWGSCSAKKNLNFNWRIIMAPPEVVDYLVVHEMCHLLQLNHSPQFWKEVGRILPDYQIQKKWLRDHGTKLSF